MKHEKELLNFLNMHRGEYVSGEVIAKNFSVTRQAVYKMMKQLIAQGYQIDCVPNRGYCMSNQCDLLASSLIEEWTGVPAVVYATVNSTNLVAKEKFPLTEGIVVSDSQTEGKRKDGGEFYSPKEGIYMSAVFQTTLPLTSILKIRKACAKAVKLCVEQNCQTQISIHNIDELFVGEQKVGGILIEGNINLATKTLSSLIVGVGIYTDNTGVAPLGTVIPWNTRNRLIADLFLSLKKTLCKL